MKSPFKHSAFVPALAKIPSGILIDTKYFDAEFGMTSSFDRLTYIKDF